MDLKKATLLLGWLFHIDGSFADIVFRGLLYAAIGYYGLHLMVYSTSAMVGIIAKKIGMTSLYQGDHLIPCTILQTGACTVTQIKTTAQDGYEAVQLSYDEKKPKHTSKSLQGHFKAAGTTPKKKTIEFRNFTLPSNKPSVALGNPYTASDIFEEGEFIDVTATSKGKGFCGVVKRHGFSGVGQRTHGQHNRERAPGSIGGSSFPSRVFKGMRMAGRTGGQRVTIKNLQVIKILPEKNLMILKGSIPGPSKRYIILQK